MITCKKCGQEKDPTEFYKDGKKKDGTTRYRPECKTCYNIKHDSEARKKAKEAQLPVEPAVPATPQLQDKIVYPEDDWDPGA